MCAERAKNARKAVAAEQTRTLVCFGLHHVAFLILPPLKASVLPPAAAGGGKFARINAEMAFATKN